MFQDLNINTICALATPQGSGAIAVVRISGKDAIPIVSSIFRSKKGIKLEEAKGYSLLYGDIIKDGQLLDEVLVSLYRSPASYTGEDCVEISCHGSSYITSQIVMLLLENGAKLAEPGEFTKRAFMNGKMDLAQAESVADLIASETSSAHRVAMQQMKGGFSNELKSMRESLVDIVALMELELDFSEEDVEFADRSRLRSLLSDVIAHNEKLISSFSLGNAIKNGVPVAIVGATNTGKSTLLNAILGEERAIVSSIHGTTRDSIEDTINLNGILFRFIDTAGIRSTGETIEMIGIERTYSKIKQASVVIMMLDATRPEYFDDSIINLSKRIDNSTQNVVVLLNKIDAIDSDESLAVEENGVALKRHKYSKEELLKMVDDVVKEAGLSPIATIPISAKSNLGLETLRDVLVDSQKELAYSANRTLVTNLRHWEALKDANNALYRVEDGLNSSIPTDLVAQDIREALYHLGSIVGEVSTDEILGNIFGRFCIGK